MILKVAEGILDVANKEFRSINLASDNAVSAYASSINIDLSDASTKHIREACNIWIKGVEDGSLNGTDDYYLTIEQPLGKKN